MNAADEMTAVVFGDSYSINPYKRYCECCLTSERRNKRHVPIDHDITSIVFESDLPDCVESVQINIGGQVVITVPCNMIKPGQDILRDMLVNPKDVLPLSRASYMHTYIVINMFESAIMDMCELYDTEEEEVSELYSDDECDVRLDNGDIVRGRRVTYAMRKTGRKVKRYRDTVINLPKVTISMLKNMDPDKKSTTYVDVWEFITIHPKSMTREVYERYKAQFKIKSYDQKNIDDLYESGQDFKAVVVNQIKFQENMAGKCYSFH